MRKVKVFYFISDLQESLAFEWIASKLDARFDLHFFFIGKAKPKLFATITNLGKECTFISDTEYPSYFSMFLRLCTILRKEKPDVVHSHLWRANLVAQSAAWICKIRKRIFTRHHGSIHYTEFPSGRKFDRLLNYLATDIVAISNNVFDILVNWDKADRRKVTTINHGFDLHYFQNADRARINDVLSRHNFADKGPPVIGVIARYLEWKGIQFAIPAFKLVRKEFNDAHLVLANASGNYADEIKTLLSELPPDSYTEILFESDLAALYKSFDVFVHVPTDSHSEAFGQTFVEALAAGVPSVFTLSGVATEFIKDRYNALVVDYKDSKSLASSVMQILDDENLRIHLIQNGINSVQAFSLDKMVSKLEALYA